MKTYYYLYQITNLVNAKIYIGVHKTRNLDDGYMGSGKVIRAAIEKHGIINFRKDILEFFETAEAMYAREKEVVTEEFLLREDTYNLRRGGTGGFDYINSNKLNYNLTYEARSRGGKDHVRFLSSPDRIQKRVQTRKKTVGFKTFTGKRHSDESKNKISSANKNKRTGIKNSQHGTCWIYHELVGNKKCKKDLLPLYIDQGWSLGRKL